MKKISVLMSTYKEPEKYLYASIESILKQTYKNFEFIIIIDNPENKTRILNLIKQFKDDRIKILVNQTNMGLVKSLNKGLKYCKGEYIARMDADDISSSHRFEYQIKFLEENDLDIVSGNFELFNDDGTINRVYHYPQYDDSCKKHLKKYSCLPHPAWLGKKKVFIKCGGYRDISTCEDYDFLIRASLLGFKMGNVQDTILKYRYNLDSISRKNSIKQDLISKFLSNHFRKCECISIDDYNHYIESNLYKIKFSIKSFINVIKLKVKNVFRKNNKKR